MNIRVPILLILALLVGVSCRNAQKDVVMPASAEGADLYRNHCAACHGEQGYGNGPAAIALEVRPRDFRGEPFRYVSTMSGVPQRADLIRTLRNGRRYGSMPAHPRLSDREIALLADYVLDVHRLGWERRLADESGEGEEISAAEIKEIAREKIAPEDPITVGSPPAGFKPNTEKAHKLYMESCAACHGPTGRGDGLDMPKDEQGRPIAVRDLTIGEFRGGIGLQEVFRRIRCGVPGTPMASQALLSDEEVWQLTYYSLYLAGRYSYDER